MLREPVVVDRDRAALIGAAVGDRFDRAVRRLDDDPDAPVLRASSQRSAIAQPTASSAISTPSTVAATGAGCSERYPDEHAMRRYPRSVAGSARYAAPKIASRHGACRNVP